MRDFNEPLPELIQNIINSATMAKNDFYNGLNDDLKAKGFSNRNISRMQKPKKKKGSPYFFKKK